MQILINCDEDEFEEIIGLPILIVMMIIAVAILIVMIIWGDNWFANPNCDEDDLRR